MSGTGKSQGVRVAVRTRPTASFATDYIKVSGDSVSIKMPKREEKRVHDRNYIASKKDPKEKKQNLMKEWFFYILYIPLTHLQYITIPDPLSNYNKNFYPLSLFMSIIWIFVYAYIIVWFTYKISETCLTYTEPCLKGMECFVESKGS